MIDEQEPLSKNRFLYCFARVNLVNDRTWCGRTAAASREAIIEQMQGRTTVLLGAKVVAALGFCRPPAGSWQRRMQIRGGDVCVDDMNDRWTHLPHPSGLNRWYNDPTNRRQAAELLAELYRESRSALGLPISQKVPA